MSQPGLKSPSLWIAIVIGLLGILMRLDLIRIVKLSAYSFWPIASAFVLLGLTTLTSSKTPSWWIGMILGILGFLNKFDMVMIPLLPGFAFWFVAVGFMLLVISAVFRKI